MAVREYELTEPSTMEELRKQVASLVLSGDGSLSIRATPYSDAHEETEGDEICEFTLALESIQFPAGDGLTLTGQHHDPTTHAHTWVTVYETGEGKLRVQASS